MQKLEKMKKRIDSLLKVFTSITTELDSDITELNNDIATNNETIKSLEDENVVLAENVKEFETLKTKIETLLK